MAPIRKRVRVRGRGRRSPLRQGMVGASMRGWRARDTDLARLFSNTFYCSLSVYQGHMLLILVKLVVFARVADGHVPGARPSCVADSMSDGVGGVPITVEPSGDTEEETGRLCEWPTLGYVRPERCPGGPIARFRQKGA